MAKRELTEEEKIQIKEARDKHGEIGLFLPRGELVAIRSASAGEYQRFQDKSAKAFGGAAAARRRGNAPSIYDAQRELALCCMVIPDYATEAGSEKCKAILHRSPALASTFADKATELAGDDVEEIEGN